jgi:hypothetical protein
LPPISLKKIPTFLSVAFSSLILLWLLLRWVIFDQFWPLAIANTVAFYFFMPLPLLLAFTLVQRQKLALITLLLPISVFLWLWGALFLPPLPGPTQKPAPPLNGDEL